MLRKELTISDIRRLKDKSIVYIIYLDGDEFDLEYCKTIPENTFYEKTQSFEDKDGNIFDIDELILYMEQKQLKVFSIEDTYLKEKKKLTNYEKIKNMTIEEMADFINNITECSCCNNLISREVCCNEENCKKNKLLWLKQECE